MSRLKNVLEKFDIVLIPRCDNMVIRHKIEFLDRLTLYQIR